VALDPYSKISPGEVLPGLPARPWNDMLDMLSEWKAGDFDKTDPTIALPRGAGIISIRNDTGSELPRFSILGITGFLITPDDNLQQFKNRPVLKGDAPAATDLERFVITQEPCRADGVCLAMLLGMTAVQIDVVDETDDYADITTGNFQRLQSQPYGSAWIVYKESGTGTKWGLVVHGVQGSQFVLGKTNAAHAKGASGTINVYRGTTAGSEAFTGSKTISAWNRFADVASGKWVLCVRLQRVWHLVAAECA
jgi:hypothetical protein